MVNTALRDLTHMTAQLHAQMIITTAQQEPMRMVVKSKQPALNVLGDMMPSVVPHTQTALHYASLMKRNARLLVKMITAAHYLLHVWFKTAISTGICVLYIVQVCVMMAKSCVQEEEMMSVAKNLPTVYPCRRNCGVMMKGHGAPDSVLPNAKIGNKCVTLYKTLVMDAQLSPCANQKQRT